MILQTSAEDETSGGVPDTMPEAEPDENMNSPVELDVESGGVVSSFRADFLLTIFVVVWGLFV